MTIVEFITKLERLWPFTQMSAESGKVYTEKLRRFSEGQLDTIMDRLLETCKRRPTVADIYESALDMKMLQKERPKNYDQYTWTQTQCPYCHGEGALMMILHTEFIKRSDGTGLRKEITLRRIFSQSSADQIDFEWAEGDAQFCFRCDCEAGTGRPGGWPVFKPDRFLPCNAVLEFKKIAQMPSKPVISVLRDFRSTKQILEEIKADFDGWQ